MNEYVKLEKLGEGSYGAVYKCQNKTNGDIVAVKKFSETLENPVIRMIALREIRLLKKLKHPNLVNLFAVFHQKRKLYLVFEFCNATLLDEINRYALSGFPETKTAQIIWECLQGLDYCHAHRCIHRDIKPENILLSENGSVKLCDFGFARILSPGENYTDYVATRWYRAPELLVGDTQYSCPVDVWALGCVMAEIIMGHALWPGKSDIDQLFLVISTIGRLCGKHLKIFENNKFYRNVIFPNPTTLQSLKTKVNRASMLQIDFLEKCFEADPDKRWTSRQLLTHDYFQKFRFYSKISNRNVQKNKISKEFHNFLPNIIKRVFPTQKIVTSNKPKNNYYLPLI